MASSTAEVWWGVWDSTHTSYCGPANEFKICYCWCPICRDPEGRCICTPCGGAHLQGEHFYRVGVEDEAYEQEKAVIEARKNIPTDQSVGD